MYKADFEPDIPAGLGKLSNYSTEQLKDLLNNDEKFEELIKDNTQVISVFAFPQF